MVKFKKNQFDIVFYLLEIIIDITRQILIRILLNVPKTQNYTSSKKDFK